MPHCLDLFCSFKNSLSSCVSQKREQALLQMQKQATSYRNPIKYKVKTMRSRTYSFQNFMYFQYDWEDEVLNRVKVDLAG